MNALYLKDLADKTRRGLEGRVREGRSSGGLCYGYDVVPGEERGGRVINTDQAEIVRRIFTEFAPGKSPKAIAKAMNADGIPVPRGALWRDTAIRGHRQRGTGILNNELYIGRLIWNRLRYIKDPASGKRVSRPNPESDWIIEEVPELRLLDDTAWEAVKTRQSEIETRPGVQAMKATRFWEQRRAKHLLTGLVTCGCCGGRVTAIGKDYLGCANARKLETCAQRKTIRRDALEERILDLLRDNLMQPAAVQAFIEAYHKEINAGRDQEDGDRARQQKEHATVTRKLEGLYDAIADGLRSPGLMEKVTALECQKQSLEAALDAPAPSPVRLHPNLSEVYRQKIIGLSAALADPAIRDEALGLLRGLIESVELRYVEETWEIDLKGEIARLVDMGSPETRKPRADAGAWCTVKVVAGAGSQHCLARVNLM